MKQIVAALVGMVCLAGCAGLPASSERPLLMRPSSAKPQAETRALSFVVNGPATLAAGDRIVNGDVNGIIAAGGGNIIAAGGGNIIAAGGGNIIAAGGGNYRVQAAVDRFRPVEEAVIHLENDKGERLSEYFKTSADGSITLEQIPEAKVMFAIARFKVNDKIYRVATPISKGGAGLTFFLDPINAMVTAKVQQVVKADKLTSLTLEQLKDVWMICNEAEVEVDLEALEASQKWSDLTAFYEKLLPQIKDADKRAVVEDFLTKLGS